MSYEKDEKLVEYAAQAITTFSEELKHIELGKIDFLMRKTSRVMREAAKIYATS